MSYSQDDLNINEKEMELSPKSNKIQSNKNKNIIIINKNKLCKNFYLKQDINPKNKKISSKIRSSSNEKKINNFKESVLKEINMMKDQIKSITEKINHMEEKLMNINEHNNFYDINFHTIFNNNKSYKLSPDFRYNHFFKKERDYDDGIKDEDGLNFHLYRYPKYNKELHSSSIISEDIKNSANSKNGKNSELSKNVKIKNDKYLNKKRKNAQLLENYDSASSPNWSFYSNGNKKKKNCPV